MSDKCKHDDVGVFVYVTVEVDEADVYNINKETIGKESTKILDVDRSESQAYCRQCLESVRDEVKYENTIS